MEQDRLYRSLAYFVEPLPSITAEARPAFPETPRVIERFDATIEMRPLQREATGTRLPPTGTANPYGVSSLISKAAFVFGVPTFCELPNGSRTMTRLARATTFAATSFRPCRLSPIATNQG